MVIDFTYTSPQGQTIDLANNSDFILTDIDGLTSATANIAASTMALLDGDIITNAQVQHREIEIYLMFRQGVNIEAAKRTIFKAIKPKQTGVLYYTHQGRSVEIRATVEQIQMPRFVNNVVMQIKFYCAFPFWRDVQWMINNIKRINALHHFKMTVTAANPIVFGVYQGQIMQTIYNSGDVSTGATFEIVAFETVTNPKIERVEDGGAFQIMQTMQAGDVMQINTTRGHKAVTLNGTNIINNVVIGSDWLQLDVGNNTFTLTDDTNAQNVYLQVKYKRSFV